MNYRILYYLIFNLLFISSCSEDDTNTVLGPPASVSGCITFVEDGGLVNFKANCLEMNDELEWDFGDNTTSADSTPSHTYENPGSYTVVLEIKRSIGTTEVESVTVEIDEICKVCECHFPTSPDPTEIDFCGTGIKAEDFCSSTCLTNPYCNRCREN